MKTTARTIQDALRSYATNHKYVLQNSYVFNWESDFFSMTKTGNVYEYEVKISKADFKKDFDKRKHYFLSNYNTGRIIEKDTKERDDFILWTGNKVCADNYNKNGAGTRNNFPYCKVEWHDSNKFFIPNRFYFVCPQGLLSKYQVPAYAGLIIVSGYSATEIKRAPILHKRNLFDDHGLTKILLEKFYYLSENIRRDISFAKHELWEAKEKVKNLTKLIEENNIQHG